TDSLAALEAWYDELFDEDLTLTEGVQRGYASGAFSPGPINELEVRIVHQQQLIRRFLLQGLKSQIPPIAGGSHSAALENAAGFEFLVRKYSQSQGLREKALIP
ncbi:MAG: RHO alpha subunit C-terminal catalytic domain-containing protein, partial [Cyanobacteria bacterium P01_F01_bin.4]